MTNMNPHLCGARLEGLEARRLLAADLQWQPLGEPGSGGRIDAVTVSPHDPDRVLLAGDILGTGVSVDAGQSWLPTTGWQSWEHSDFTWHPTDPNIVWAGTNSGPHQSTDGGANWTAKRSGLPPATGYGYPASVETVLFDAGDPTHTTLLAFGGDHRRFKDGTNADQVPNYGKIWRSRDGGETWSQISQVPTGVSGSKNNIMAAAFGAGSHETVWVAVAESGVWRSSNDGENGTWQKRSNGLPTLGNGVAVWGLVAHPTNPNFLHAVVGTAQGNVSNRQHVGGVFRTTDGGLNWTKVEDGDPSGYWPPDFKHIAQSADGNTLWAVDNNWSGGMGAYRSTDAGLTWQHVLTQSNVVSKLVDSTPFDSGIVNGWWAEISPHDSDTVYLGTTTSVFVTRDGGDTWNDALNTPTGNGHRASGYTGWVANNAEFSPFNDNKLVVQGWDRLLATVSNDGGWSYEMTQPGLPRFNGGNDVAFAADGTMFAALGQGNTSNQIARSTDGGNTWQVLKSPSSVSARAWSVHVNKDNANEVWAAVGSNLYRSTNALTSAGSVSWQQLNVDGKQVQRIAPVLTFQNDFYVTTDAGTYFTNNGGNSVEFLGGPTQRVRLTVDPSNANVIYAASNDIFGDPGVWRHERFGSGWMRLSLPNQAERYAAMVAVDPTNPQRLAVGTNQDSYLDVSGANGVWLSEDGGATWSQQIDNLPMLRINSLTFSPDGSRLIAGTGGRGFFAAEIGLDSFDIQAEHMTLGGLGDDGFAAVDDATAEGGRYVVATAGNNYGNADAATLSFTFTLDEPANDVRLSGRVRTPEGELGDSFYVRINRGPWQLWDVPESAASWSWGVVRDRNATSDYVVDLSAGRHVVEVKVREAPTQLDALKLLLPGDLAVLPGDANGDGRVDLLDFALLRANFGRTVTDGFALGDFNDDDVVNLLDFAILRGNFGAVR